MTAEASIVTILLSRTCTRIESTALATTSGIFSTSSTIKVAFEVKSCVR